MAAARKLTARMLHGRPNYVEIQQALVTRENINALIKAEDLDVLSIDVDGMDFWLWKAFDRTQPRLVVMEYNASFGGEESNHSALSS